MYNTPKLNVSITYILFIFHIVLFHIILFLCYSDWNWASVVWQNGEVSKVFT